jgi:outer membrane immunogenic protein
MPRVALLAFTLTSVVALASANAADMYVPGPAGPGGYKDTPYVASWAGFYAGVNGGYGWANGQTVNLSDNKGAAGIATGSFGSPSSDGGFGGGQIGYNWQGVWHPNLVLGVEADIQGAGVQGSSRVQTTLPYNNTVDAKTSLDWFGTVRGRLGYAFGNALVYGTGGLAFGGVHDRFVLTPNFPPAETAVLDNSSTRTGYAAGGGIEYKFSPAWSVKAEYQHIDLGSESLTGIYSATGHVVTSSKVDDQYDTVRGGLNYHFGSLYTPLK